MFLFKEKYKTTDRQTDRQKQTNTVFQGSTREMFYGKTATLAKCFSTVYCETMKYDIITNKLVKLGYQQGSLY